MRALIQRVSRASVITGGTTVGSIGPGLLVLAGVKHGDGEEDVAWLAGKLVSLRVFNDADGRMNLSVRETSGEILLVSQFTLHGDARKGRRPSFDAAARPEEAKERLEDLKRRIEAEGVKVATGEFGAHMRVELVNDGPVTMMLESPGERASKDVASGAPEHEGSLDLRALEDPESTASSSPLRTGRMRLLGPGSPLREIPLVLASASPRRRDLLRDLGLSFTMSAADIDEEADVPPDARERARVLAERKAAATGARFQECIVLAADTIVEIDNIPYGKPSDAEQALRTLRTLAGRTHLVITGVCVAHPARSLFRTRVVTTSVRFRSVSDEELSRYVATGEPFGKAGAYSIQGLGGLLISGIAGDYSNVVGLPLGATLDLLDEVVLSQRSPRAVPQR
jgi:D-tyrosyl-tRNA(Tyr) deacylase